MKKAIIQKPPGAHNAQTVVFIHKLASGMDARDAAKLAGFSNPADAARRLLARPDVRAAIAEVNRGHDTELACKSRAALFDLLNSSLTPPAVKARIAIEALAREEKTLIREGVFSRSNPGTLDDSQIADRIARLESVLRNSGDTINASPNAQSEHISCVEPQDS